MAIVIFANDEDKQKLDDALKAAGLEYDILEPTVKNILHLAIGLADDTPAEEAPTEDESAPADETETDIVDALTGDVDTKEEKPVGESLGFARFNSEAVKLFKSSTNENVVFVQNLIPGSKTTYALNESVVSFWVDNSKEIEQFGLLEMVTVEGPKNYMGSFQIRQSPTSESYVTIAASSLELLVRP